MGCPWASHDTLELNTGNQSLMLALWISSRPATVAAQDDAQSFEKSLHRIASRSAVLYCPRQGNETRENARGIAGEKGEQAEADYGYEIMERELQRLHLFGREGAPDKGEDEPAPSTGANGPSAGESGSG